jgi:hypothetical protein
MNTDDIDGKSFATLVFGVFIFFAVYGQRDYRVDYIITMCSFTATLP